MMKNVETLNGDGHIAMEDGSSIGVRAYRLTVWQAQHDDGHGGTIPGLFSIEGYIRLDGNEGFQIADAPLVLELEDGRRLPFFFVGSSGQIAARGRLE